ncbi:MAG: hypothetical protein OQJ89_13510, partial [Kangiellaceae bacterium]|nr:hypothetical protein [Kangiellaceae bacterium]
MKVAARFPVTESPWLFHLLILFHIAFPVLGYFTVGWHWVLVFVSLSTAWSFYFCRKHYHLITNAPDDLCWSGEHWLMQPDAQLGSAMYLTILPSSWISSFACLLHFEVAGQRYYWLFSRQSLGPRVYSELVYLCRLTL